MLEMVNSFVAGGVYVCTTNPCFIRVVKVTPKSIKYFLKDDCRHTKLQEKDSESGAWVLTRTTWVRCCIPLTEETGCRSNPLILWKKHIAPGDWHVFDENNNDFVWKAAFNRSKHNGLKYDGVEEA
mmetsp:Transcript_85382/g.167045  ORF Transcript_85382/g.167045 Transcript_85382/m.167045 type:complete len:126 (-) Transcript_85382:183-560(-)